MQKKGELTSAQIISLVLTIAGFVILLLFITVFLNLSGEIDDESCHLSVLARATANEKVEGFVSLKCTTKKICLTFKEDCEQFIGEKNVQKVKLPKNALEAKTIIEEETAKAQFNCWELMGEGRLNLFGAGQEAGILSQATSLNNLYQAKSSCVICSRVAISNDVPDSILTQVNVNEYMENHKVPSSQFTYLETFTNNQLRSYPKEFESNFGLLEEEKRTKEIGIIFMQILTEDSPLEAGAETGLTVGAFIIGSTSGLSPTGKILSFKTAAAFAALASTGTAALAAFQTYQNRQVSAGYCEKLSGDYEGAKSGCSIITTMDYHNINQINDFCSIIEGNP